MGNIDAMRDLFDFLLETGTGYKIYATCNPEYQSYIKTIVDSQNELMQQILKDLTGCETEHGIDVECPMCGEELEIKDCGEEMMITDFDILQDYDSKEAKDAIVRKYKAECPDCGYSAVNYEPIEFNH